MRVAVLSFGNAFHLLDDIRVISGYILFFIEVGADVE
jgi:hypothetical protein